MVARVSHPPKVHPVLHIGVTGHRPPRLAPEHFAGIKEAIRQIIQEAAPIFGELAKSTGIYEVESPLVRVISPLAEGADRLAAYAALECGMEIQCPLPFHRDNYALDFKDSDSRTEYYQLLDRATAVMELNGDRHDEGTAYLNAGKIVLEQSDLLIAVWDRKKPQGRGGTGEVVAKALKVGLVVLVVPPDGSGEITLLRQGVPCANWRQGLRAHLEKLLVLDEENARKARRYFAEAPRRLNYGWIFTAFRRLVTEGKPWGGPLLLKKYTAPPPDEQGRGQSSRKIQEKAAAALSDHHTWADNLSVFYAGVFRSSYLMRYLTAFAATIASVLAFSAPSLLSPGFQAQVVLIGAAIFLVYLDKAKQWHLRSLEYRLLAENFRMLKFLFQLGLRRMSRSRSDLREPPGWVAWYLRNVARQVGLVSTAVNADYLAEHLEYLRVEEVDKQVAYHTNTAAWQATMSRRLYDWAFWAFVFGCSLLVARGLASEYMESAMSTACIGGSPGQMLCYWIKFWSFLLPATGAIFAAIRSHGEFARISSRSEAMSEFFKTKQQILAHESELDWEASVLITREITEEMQMEIGDWRTLTGGKSLNYPV